MGGVISVLAIIGGIVAMVATQFTKHEDRCNGDRPWYSYDDIRRRR